MSARSTISGTTTSAIDQNTDNKTVQDFGEQWTGFTTNEGYYGSSDCLRDILGDLVTSDEIAGKTVADIGSGTGRIVNMLLDLGAAFVSAIEPSAAFEILKKNTAERCHKVQLIRAKGEAIGSLHNLDMVFSIGVLHHIVEPAPVVAAAYKALRCGGKMVIWLYSYEGNELYLSVFLPLRSITTRLPHRALSLLSHFLCLFLNLYVFLCKFFNLPMRSYMQNHIARLSYANRHLTVYDQLNPAYAKYYRQSEARALLEQNGFQNVRMFQRHGYSWTVVGEKV